jgi:predicted dehydrogenase
MREIGVGVIGTGFMGKAHSFAYRAVAGIFPGSLRPVLQSVADINGRAAEQAAKQFGYLRQRTDWRNLVEDQEIEIVSITTPNVVHREMALAAIAAGKHVHCEKPITPNADAAKDMMDATEAAGVVTQ